MYLSALTTATLMVMMMLMLMLIGGGGGGGGSQCFPFDLMFNIQLYTMHLYEKTYVLKCGLFKILLKQTQFH